MTTAGSGGRPRVVVVGGGIAGLSAAWRLRGQVELCVLESGTRWGGKIATEPFAGLELDTGPDAFLTRNPKAVELCVELGLGDDLVAPATGAAYLWSRGRLRRLPAGTVLGVPTDLLALARARVLSPAGVARCALDLVLPTSGHGGGDRSVGSLVGPRLGPEAHLRLVEPLVGGINAGRTDELSLSVVAPQIAAGAGSRSLLRGLRAVRSSVPPTPGPVFLTIAGGMARLVDRLVTGLDPEASLHAGEGAASLEPDGGGWLVTTTGGRRLVADAVILSTPAPASATLLSAVCPEAASELARIAYASVVLVTFAYPAAAVDRTLDGSGFLVPRVEGRLMTACSWVNAKWPHLDRPGTVVLRVSSGRDGDDRAMGLDDGELVARLHAELASAMRIRAAASAAAVHRWPDGFPQFAVGHLDRVARIESALDGQAPGVAVAGAALRGVGIPACIASGQAAADRVLHQLGASHPNPRVSTQSG